MSNWLSAILTFVSLAGLVYNTSKRCWPRAVLWAGLLLINLTTYLATYLKGS